jgi:hypothetical protein
MGTFKMILYPFGMAILAMVVVTLFGMAVFGPHSTDWMDWQNELVGTMGTVIAFGSAMFGLWLAIRSEQRVAR